MSQIATRSCVWLVHMPDDGDEDVALFHLFTFISGFPSLLPFETMMMMTRVLPVAAAILATAAGIAEER